MSKPEAEILDLMRELGHALDQALEVPHPTREGLLAALKEFVAQADSGFHQRNTSRVLMAIAHILGAWDGEMRIPPPSRQLLVAMDDHRWALDERGYPIPSPALIAEMERLRQQEK